MINTEKEIKEIFLYEPKFNQFSTLRSTLRSLLNQLSITLTLL